MLLFQIPNTIGRHCLVVWQSCTVVGISVIVVIGLLFNGNIHILVFESLFLFIIPLLFVVPLMSVLVNTTSQSLPQSTGFMLPLQGPS